MKFVNRTHYDATLTIINAGLNNKSAVGNRCNYLLAHELKRNLTKVYLEKRSNDHC